MDSNKWAYIGYTMAWIFTGMTTAVYLTTSAKPIWFMLIPACISISNHESNDDENK